MKKLALVVVLALAVFGVRAEDAALPTIFVAPLDGDAAEIEGWQPALGQGLAEMVITELTKLKKFEVLESTALKSLKDEIKLGEEGYVAEGEKVQKGGWAGADFMFRAKVTRFGSKTQHLNLGGFVPRAGGDLGLKQSKSDVQIDWRIVDSATRKILKAGSATGEEKGMGFDVGTAVRGHGGHIGFGDQEFMNSALGKATVKALKSIMAVVAATDIPASGRQKAKAGAEAAARDALATASGTVLAAPGGGVVVVSLGARNGLKQGDKLKLYQTIETKDDQGKVVFTEERLVGEVTLDSVQEDRSKASYAGKEAVKPGWIVK